MLKTDAIYSKKNVFFDNFYSAATKKVYIPLRHKGHF